MVDLLIHLRNYGSGHNHLERRTMSKAETFLTTRQVAKMVSLSMGTVQKMVDDGEFKCWFTSGGHRRVLASSVKKYLAKRMKGRQ